MEQIENFSQIAWKTNVKFLRDDEGIRWGWEKVTDTNCYTILVNNTIINEM